MAELKGRWNACIGKLDWVFHGLTAVAELKAYKAAREKDEERHFSTASPPWPN